MNSHFATAMSRALEQTRAGNPAEAARIIQAALAGKDRQPDEMARPAQAPAGSGGDPLAHIEEAEVVEEQPPRQSPPPFGASPGKGGAHALQTGQVDLQRMLDNLDCMVPQGSNGLPGLGRVNARPHVPEGALYETRSFDSEHGSRDYRLFVPSDRPGGPKGLVLMLHGCTQDPDDFAAGTQMNALAEEQTFLVAYPAQAQSAHMQRCWNWYAAGDQAREGGEPELIAGIARAVMAEFSADPTRVYAAGLSAGGAAAAILAATYPDLFAAVGIHSGLACGAARDLPGALAAMKGQAGPARTNPRAVPTIVFHGEGDRTVHPANGDQVMAQAGATPGLTQTVTRDTSPGGIAYTRTVRSDASGRPVQEQWLLHGVGHAWSGGNPAGSYTEPRGPDASRAMLRFFLSHTLAEPRARA